MYGTRRRKAMDESFISKDQCNSIKGIFILLILFSHSLPYILDAGYSYTGIDTIVPIYKNIIWQLVVVMFFFYSGYGVSLSIKKKQKPYIDAMPLNRILPTLLNFDLAVLIFIFIDIALSIPLTPTKILLSFVGWDEVGNSNWYIFCILICYLFTYICAKYVIKDKGYVLFFSLLVVVFILSFFKDRYWYNTLLCYPAGYLYANYKEKINIFIRSHYLSSILVFSILYIIFRYILPLVHNLSWNIAAILFAFIVVLITMRYEIGNNKILIWFGKNLFPIYIYQRIPMLIMSNVLEDKIIKSYPLLFILISLGATCIITCFYPLWQIKKLNRE